MEKEKVEKIIRNADSKSVVDAWNHYLEETRDISDWVYPNDETGLTNMFQTLSGTAIACSRGNYYSDDAWVCYDDNCNALSFTHIYDHNSPIDINAMAEYYSENEDEMEDYFDTKEVVYVLITEWSYDFERDTKVDVFESEEVAKAELKSEYEKYLRELGASEDSKWNDFEIYESGTHAHICEAYDWTRNSNVWDIVRKEVR